MTNSRSSKLTVAALAAAAVALPLQIASARTRHHGARTRNPQHHA